MSDCSFSVRQDDVAAILNHLEQMVNYILEESATKSFTGPPSSASTLSSMSSSPSPVPSLNSYAISPILDYILDNDVLERILEWSLQTSEFTLRLLEEQLRIFEVRKCDRVTPSLFERIPMLHGSGNRFNIRFIECSRFSPQTALNAFSIRKVS